ncbi:MAG TPA: arylsulfatase, partial [Planctomycetaceae bacterium]|nr:arylsulfatase [Planctomycetaceae bacterium]
KPAKVKPSEGGPTGQLYNLANDPDESDNLFVENPDIVARLRAELKRVERSGRSR